MVSMIIGVGIFGDFLSNLSSSSKEDENKDKDNKENLAHSENIDKIKLK